MSSGALVTSSGNCHKQLRRVHGYYHTMRKRAMLTYTMIAPGGPDLNSTNRLDIYSLDISDAFVDFLAQNQICGNYLTAEYTP